MPDLSSSDAVRLRRASRALVRTFDAYSFSFALLLTAILLALNVARTPNLAWTEQLASFAPLAIAAMASTPAILSGGGGFDLSISPLMTFVTGVYAIWLLPAGFGGPGAAIPLLLAVGVGVGLVNGLLIVLFRIPPVVATLSMFFVLIGVNLKLIAQPVYVDSDWIGNLAGTVGWLPGALLTIGAPLAAWGLLRLLPFHRALQAVGSNDVAAFASGIKVGMVRVLAYALGGSFAAVGGLALLAVTSTASASASQTYTLQAIAAVALGGTSLLGGRGGVAGALFGAASLYLLANLLITLNVSPNWLQVMYGVMLLVAVVLVGSAARRARTA